MVSICVNQNDGMPPGKLYHPAEQSFQLAMQIGCEQLFAVDTEEVMFTA